MPGGKWTRSATGFRTTAGFYCPDLIIFDTEEPILRDVMIPVIIPFAGLPQVSMSIRARGIARPRGSIRLHLHFGTRLPANVEESLAK